MISFLLCGSLILYFLWEFMFHRKIVLSVQRALQWFDIVPLSCKSVKSRNFHAISSASTFTSALLPIFAGKWIINNSCAFLCPCQCKWDVANCTLISDYCNCIFVLFLGTCFNSRISTTLIPVESLYTWYLFIQDGTSLLKSKIAYDMLDLSVEHLFSMITSEKWCAVFISEILKINMGLSLALIKIWEALSCTSESSHLYFIT